MPTDPLAAVTERIRELMTRRTNPLSSLEAIFAVTEQMDEATAKSILQRIIGQRYLCQLDGDIAQMLAAKLGVEVQWSHARLTAGELAWKEGRGE